MKAISLTIATILTLLTTAQTNPIVNGFEGFENWTTGNVGEMPTNWDGFNREVIFNGMPVGEVECIRKDSLDPKEGNYSVMMTSTSVMGGPAVPGLFTSGTLTIDWNAQNGDITGGEAFSQRPVKVKGWYKYYPVNNDTSFIALELTENNNEIGSGRIDLSGSTEDWTPFEFEIEYSSSTIPDSLNIVAASTVKSENLPEGSELHLDGLELVFETASIESNQTSLVNLYPNPTHNELKITNLQVGMNKIRLYSIQGILLESFTTENHSTIIKLNGYPASIYLLEIENKGKKALHRIVKK